MKRIDIKNNGTKILGSLIKDQNPHFIGSWNLEKNNLCKQIIDIFDENEHLHKGGVTEGGKNFAVKKTTDITINPNDLKNIKFKYLNDYIDELYKCFKDYQNQWPFLKSLNKNLHVGAFNIQRYLPGDHFAKIHTERYNIESLHRVFAWMTYLNDVDDGGSTNFSHYNIKIKPEIGKTLIWPAEWTHAHSGEILNSGAKYIVTGWIQFPHDNNL